MPFYFDSTHLPGLTVVRPKCFSDERGYFMESYKRSEFFAMGISEEFVQDNHSFSSQNVLRGVHFQNHPYEQGKLVRVIEGAVWDVAVDLRPESPTYTKWFGIELNSTDGTMLYVPPGFGHGFVVLSDSAHFVYKCTAEYVPASDAGIRWNDPDLAIDWPVAEPIVSQKDADLPYLKDI